MKLHATGRSFSFLCLAVVLLQAALAHSATFEVSPGGDINSLSAARDRVRELRLAGTNDDIIVEFQSGTYVETNTVVFGLVDSAPTNARTIYRAAPGATPIISGGQMITNWGQVATPPDHLPAAAQGMIWKASIPDLKFSCLFENGRFLPRSRSGFENMSVDANSTHYEQHRKLDYNSLLRNWPNKSDIEIMIQPKGWTCNFLPIASVDENNNTAWLAQPSSFELQGRFCVENAIDHLDKAGEWVLNTQDDALYYWPKSGAPTHEIIAPLLQELVRVEGANDTNSLAGGYVAQDVPVRGLAFEGLTFAHADRFRYEDGDIDLQHGWEVYDKASGLLRFRGAEDCVVSGCTFRDSGSCGVRLDLYCQNITVENSLFQNLGDTELVLSGYGPGQKNVNCSNTIVNNTFLDGSRIWPVAAGIYISQSEGNLIAHNRIGNFGYHGLVISSFRMGDGDMFPEPSARTFVAREEAQAIREAEVAYTRSHSWNNYEEYIHDRNNVIEYNEIYDVGNKIGSGNTIYTTGTGDNNLIQFNAIYDQGEAASMRMDQDSINIKVFKNVFIGAKGRGNIFEQKGQNQIEDNIIINGRYWGRFNVGSDATFHRNIFYHSATDNTFTTFLNLDKINKKPAKVAWCVYYHAVAGVAETCLTNQQAIGADANSIALGPQDPLLFRDVERGDFDLQTNSPALSVSSAPITADEFAQIGTLREPFLEQFLWNANHFLYNADEVDSDTDGLTDAWEMYYFGDLNQGASDDEDGDGTDNLTEFTNRTNPTLGDVRVITDNDDDGVDDRWEIDRFGSTYACGGGSDSDHDGTSNFLEYLYGSDPSDPADKGFYFRAKRHMGTNLDFEWVTQSGFALGTNYSIQISTNLFSWNALSTNDYSLAESPTNGMTQSTLTLTKDYGRTGFLKIEKP